MEKKTTVAAAVVVIVVVVIVAVAAVALTGGDDDDETGDAYYFYLDGMGGVDGWYTGTGTSVSEGWASAMDGNVDYDISESGWITTIDGNESSYDESTMEGVGYGIYVYTSTTTENPYSTYFATGPSLYSVAGNIIYITFSSYYFDENWNTVYEVNPSTNSELLSTGPFADDGYEPLDYTGTYYIYLDGMGDLNGWYSSTASDGATALSAILEGTGVEFEVSDGWISYIGDYSGSYDSETGTGSGFGIYLYTSSSTDDPYYGYFAQGPTVDSAIGNILYITFSDYHFDENWNTVYEVNPSTNPDLMSTGPFA